MLGRRGGFARKPPAPPRRCCDSVVAPRAIDGRGFSLVFQPAGGVGGGVGGGVDLGLVHSVHACLQFWFKCTFPRTLVSP